MKIQIAFFLDKYLMLNLKKILKSIDFMQKLFKICCQKKFREMIYFNEKRFYQVFTEKCLFLEKMISGFFAVKKNNDEVPTSMAACRETTKKLSHQNWIQNLQKI